MGYAFPSVREAFWKIVEDDELATPYFTLTVDFADNLPAAHITELSAVEGIVDRLDRVQVDFYVEGDADALGELFKQRIVGVNLHVEGVGLLDTIDTELAPRPLAYSSDRINVSSAIYRVSTRPKP